MPAYKSQHWLPVGYSQFFSASPMGRESIIWVTSGAGARQDTANNIAASNYLYSKEDPEAAERQFHIAEGSYPQIVRALIEGREVPTPQRVELLFTQLGLHFRNPVYRNDSSGERGDGFERMARSFLVRRVADFEEKDAQEVGPVVEAAMAKWEVAIVEIPPPSFLWTSDHPSILFFIDGIFALAILPVDPNHVLVSYRKERVELLSSVGTPEDARVLNTYQVLVCQRELYSDRDLAPQGSGLVDRLRSRPSADNRGSFSDGSWTSEVVAYPHDNLVLSFVRVR